MLAYMPLKADGELIKTLRLERGWTSAQLANKAKVSRVHAWRIEEGLRLGSPETRLKIAKALGVPVARITREETPEETERRRSKKAEGPADDNHRREKRAA
jgi:transcriptional regulator with XRE-family HTH domain